MDDELRRGRAWWRCAGQTRLWLVGSRRRGTRRRSGGHTHIPYGATKNNDLIPTSLHPFLPTFCTQEITVCALPSPHTLEWPSPQDLDKTDPSFSRHRRDAGVTFMILHGASFSLGNGFIFVQTHNSISLLELPTPSLP